LKLLPRAVVQPSVRQQFHLTNAQYGELIAAFSITYGLSAPLMGWLLDRFGLTRVATVAVGLWSLASMATGWAASFSELLVCRAVLGDWCEVERATPPLQISCFRTFVLS